MANWTEPKSWTAEKSTLTGWNTYLQQNMEALKNPPTDSYAPSYSAGTLYTTSSATFTDINAVYELSLTTKGGDILICFRGAISTIGGVGYLDISFDGTRLGGPDGILSFPADVQSNVSMIWLKQEVIAGTYTIKPQWKTAGTNNLVGNSIPQFWAREVS